MAYITETSFNLRDTVSAVLNSISTNVTMFLLDLYSAGARAEMLNELHSLDADTLKTVHGINREQIVTHVFRNKVML